MILFILMLMCDEVAAEQAEYDEERVLLLDA
jgi:hypothetical protein